MGFKLYSVIKFMAYGYDLRKCSEVKFDIAENFDRVNGG